MKVSLVRHGQTDFNLNNLMQGWIDIELNENGINQAIELAEKLKHIKFDIIYCSDLKRALKTAQIIKERNYYNVEIIIDNRLREQNMGIWEGMNFNEVLNENKEFFIKIKQNPFLFNPPKGETFLELYSRIKAFIDDLENSDFENILIVGHQIVNSVIYFIINNLDWKLFWDYKQKNGEIWQLHIKSNRTITNS